MITPLLTALLLALPGGHPGSAVAFESPAGMTAAAPPQEHAPAAGQGAEAPEEPRGEEGEEKWGTETMMHDIVDSRTLGIGSVKLDLTPLTLPPVRVGPLTIDLSVTKHVVFLWVAALLTILTMSLAARTARRIDHSREAPRGIMNVVEAFYVYLRDDVALANIGAGGERFVPYVVTLFFFVLYSNLLGLVPFGATATSNIMVTAALAIISFVVVEVAGFRALGPKGYLGTIFYVPRGMHPAMKPVMLAIMTPVELIGKLAKPFALAVRLFANMTAGHFVLLSLLGLILMYGSFTGAIGLTAVVGSLALGIFVMLLEIFVALLQAYIFTILTAVFIGLIRQAH
jgi:F-type H+-transporting ATPase subunit a